MAVTFVFWDLSSSFFRCHVHFSENCHGISSMSRAEMSRARNKKWSYWGIFQLWISRMSRAFLPKFVTGFIFMSRAFFSKMSRAPKCHGEKKTLEGLKVSFFIYICNVKLVMKNNDLKQCDVWVLVWYHCFWPELRDTKGELMIY